MPRTVTLRLDEATCRFFKAHSEADNRPLSNLIATAAKRYLEGIRYMSRAEQRAIESNKELMARIKEGSRDYRLRRGRYVD